MKDATMGFLAALLVIGVAYWISLQVVSVVVAIWLVPISALLLPLLLPNMKWLAGAFVFILLAISVLLIEDSIVTSAPDYSGSPAEGLGLAMLMFTGIGAAIGSSLRVGVYAWRKGAGRTQQSVQPDRREDAAPG